jgi:hypothetical protein
MSAWLTCLRLNALPQEILQGRAMAAGLPLSQRFLVESRQRWSFGRWETCQVLRDLISHAAATAVIETYIAAATAYTEVATAATATFASGAQALKILVLPCSNMALLYLVFGMLGPFMCGYQIRCLARHCLHVQIADKHLMFVYMAASTQEGKFRMVLR